MADLCPDCGREYAASYSLWLGSDSFCGMSPAWNRDGERHDDCINECLYASRNRLRVQLSRAQAEIAELRAAALELCDGLPRDASCRVEFEARAAKAQRP